MLTKHCRIAGSSEFRAATTRIETKHDRTGSVIGVA